MKKYFRIPLLLTAWALAGGVAVVAIATGGYFYVEPSLGEASELRNLRFQTPLGVYSRDGRLIEQFGDQMRTPVPYEEIPEVLIRAVIAAEDDTFFDHPGIDYAGSARAAFNFIRAGGDRVPGASTITQQVARRNFNLTLGVSLVRKFKEWILAFRIEQEFTKQEILGLYLNTEFLGYRSYGVATAARTYFNKSLDQLTLSEAAIIAGTFQRPSEWNPYYSVENARARRAYVLRRLRTLGWINEAEFAEASVEPIESHRYNAQQAVLRADYVAEMARAEMFRRFGPAAYTDGFKVTTTIDSRLQAAANEALRTTLIDYDERHGYRGPLARIDLEEEGFVDAESGELDENLMRAYLDDYEDVLALSAAVVIDVDDLGARVFFADQGLVEIGLDSVQWARRYVSDIERGPAIELVSDVLVPGDVVRFRRVEDGTLRLGQLPDVQGAFVSLDPRDGAVVALVGGLDFFLSKYNRATQAARQPGSSFKPFVYSAALENGYTLASIINDAPIVEESTELETTWKPDNFEGVAHGETRLRVALRESMNLSAIRTLRDVGITNAISHVRKFGFGEEALPRNLNLALGGGSVSPIELATAYATFANGGYRVSHYFIDRIEDANGDVLYDASRSVRVVCEPIRVDNDGQPLVVPCPGEASAAATALRPAAPPKLIERKTDLYPVMRRAERVVSEQNVYLMTDIMRDVIRSGSGARAGRALQRGDIAGKTGTTNGPRDAWFAGFNADIVATGWVGFDDDSRPLGGNAEQGGRTTIPMWISFMAEALKDMPEHSQPRPPGIIEMRINPENGLVASDANPNTIFEKFRVGHVPAREPDAPFTLPRTSPGQPPTTSGEPIF